MIFLFQYCWCNISAGRKAALWQWMVYGNMGAWPIPHKNPFIFNYKNRTYSIFNHLHQARVKSGFQICLLRHRIQLLQAGDPVSG